MNNPTNWPNPERPGVPMFPEREMRHVLKKKDTGEVIIRNWKPDGQHWDMIGRSASWCSDTYFYEGTFITPTRIAELLAGERERCAKLLEDAYEKTGKDFEYLGCLSCADEIRNLGAAP